MAAALEAVEVDGGLTTCTEFRDLHDVPAQEMHHKARLSGA